jgi:hypothetical protein
MAAASSGARPGSLYVQRYPTATLRSWAKPGSLIPRRSAATSSALLRTRRRRPSGRGGADERDEVAAPDHSIISSARAGISAVPKE